MKGVPSTPVAPFFFVFFVDWEVTGRRQGMTEAMELLREESYKYWAWQKDTFTFYQETPKERQWLHRYGEFSL